MMLALARRLRASQNERGAALLIVLGVGMLMLLIVAGGMTVAAGGLQKTDRDQDVNGALDAAFAGVEEYQSRLASDPAYYRYGNPAAAFSSPPISSSTVTLPTGSSANAAFGVGTAGTWATVPGSSPVASFRYEVDNSQYASTGTIRLRSTGKVGTATRSIVADLRQTGFIDYLIFTDYQALDPALTGQTQCEQYIWAGRPGSCSFIYWSSPTVVQGTLHSNDTLTMCGARFEGRVTSSNPLTPITNVPWGCSNATYTVGGGTTYQAPIEMPPTNSELKKETRNDLTASEVPIPGCLYTGPTVITFTSNGKMNVRSPWTIRTNVSQTTGVPSTSPAQCGTPGTGTGALGSSTGATIDVLPSNVIYVQNVPTLTTDPNFRSTPPSGFACVNSNTGWTFGTDRYPATNEITPTGSTSTNPAYGCRNGDLFVQGTFNGAATIAAENYVYITGDLVYADAADDILGIVGNKSVFVWNPMRNTSSGVRPLLTDTSRTINGSVLSVTNTFSVQNHANGSTSRGTLRIFGSIAQKFQGVVGLSGGVVGYQSAYTYDTRLSYMAPPKFLSPVSSSYGITQYATVPAAFTATGATP